jgi:GNAT superfamily N-acetyltransferase
MTSKIEVKKVTVNIMMMEFIKLPWTAHIYDDDPAWVAPVISDRKKFFDPEHGYFFEHGEAEFFIAYKDGKPAGRITAHTYSPYEEKYDKDTGFFGFYECIDDLEVSKALFEKARDSLRAKGKKKMNGPQSFTIYDEIGFDCINNGRMPVMGMSHYAPWYEKHALAFGLQKQVDWFCFMVKTQYGLKWEPLFKIREELQKKSDIKFITGRKRDIPNLAEDIRSIFNMAWEGNEGHLPVTDKQFHHIFNDLKLIVIPELAIFAEKDGKTVGFILSIPDANPGYAKLNGRLYPWRIVKALWKIKRTKTLRTSLMGVLPEYRGQDIDQIFILMTLEIGVRMGYKQSDCSLIVETNKKMIGALKYINADRYKGYRVFQMDI